MMTPTQDIRWMRYAIALARRGRGRTAENPAVGCVIVQKNYVVGVGWTADGGRPHAETEALARAGDRAKGATVYVTLEPCSHYGKTPPCARALTRAQVKRVVVATLDEDRRVSGRGVAMLQQAGILVTLGVCAQEAAETHAGFMRRVRTGLPQVSVKIATSKDEKITKHTAQPWITGVQARNFGHILRREHHAIVTGIGTVLADNPMLNCRLAGLEHTSPVRVIIDRQLRMPLDANVVRTATQIPTWIVTSITQQEHPHGVLLQKMGVQMIYVHKGDFAEVLQALGAKGITSILVEGGQGITEAALASGCVQQCYWFEAQHRIGAHAMPAVLHKDGLWHYLQGWQCRETMLWENGDSMRLLCLQESSHI
ncbi:MAG: bifunctional diaminohydroxyphosphoribosylaminopyrimidine deaminase/5-amino-6-(5-phosphoribosylamino)uracil reductase RibD [Alphaproteobacteria bacterium]|nr:MAG: bifunctional diaminohydroxyphosphoribosylaminopyrimidine deaminase/5-amino-6-(5-phosphoribosylamino)uracil reductase RibD [Alphaproteobacteria bacterium]